MKLLVYCLLLCSMLTEARTTSARPCKTTKSKTITIAPIYQVTNPFSLPALPYAFDDLEPYIDKETMEIHHNKHHQAYVNNLNAALKDHPKLHNKTLYELLNNLTALPHTVRNAIRNQGGGHFNHSLFWTMMTPKASLQPSGPLAQQIATDFGSFTTLQEQFNAAAKTVFGSGWAWLVTDRCRNLSIVATHNQDSPLGDDSIPILGLDVWEHAYYLKYQNRRGDYITAFWHVINWSQVQNYYEKAKQ